MVTVMTKDDESYYKQILNEINSSEGLKIAFEKSLKAVKDAKNYKVESSFEGPVTDDTEVPFALLDNPAHPAECSELSGDELKKCVSQTISKHVSSRFDTSKFKDLDSGKYRVSVKFKIDKNGEITNVRARGQSIEMENEALRVIETLPQFIPGKVNGEPVGVLYGLPINFVIN
jgi:protein TonB